MLFLSKRKTKKAPYQVARWFTLLFITTTTLSVLSPLIFSMPKASAAGEEYVFYHPQENTLVRTLQNYYDQGFRDALGDDKGKAEHGQTSVWMKGGIWEGQNPVRMQYDKEESKTNSRSNWVGEHDYVYSVSFRCDEGVPVRGGGSGDKPDNGYYQVKVVRKITINVNNDNGNRFFDKTSFDSDTKVEAHEYGKKPAPDPSGYTPDWDPLREVNVSQLPQKCRVGEGKSQTKYFHKLPPAEQAAWNNMAENDTAVRSGNSVAGAEEVQANCINFGSLLGVFICPLIDGLAGVSDWVFSFLDTMLNNVPIGLSPDDPGFRAWQTFRILGNVVLVGALLAMVFAQTFGERFIDAYALRKMAPRILVGAILINLSIYIGVAAADITKVIGKGIGQLMTEPFIGDSGNFDFVVGGDVLTSFLTGAGVALGGGLMFMLGRYLWQLAGTNPSGRGAGLREVAGLPDWQTIGMWVFLFILLPIMLIALAILITIAIRQGLLVFLIVIAPIAFALYVLPGTEKYFRKWWSWFIKTLLVYPIIAIMFALSDILAFLIFSNNPEPQAVMAGVAIMFAPLAMVPFSFSFAGGPMSSIWGAATGTLGKLNAAGRAQQAFQKSRQDHTNGYFGRRAEAKKGEREALGLTAGSMLAGTAAGIRSRRGGGSYRDGYRFAVRDRANRLESAHAQHLHENNEQIKALGTDGEMGAALMLAAQTNGNRTRLRRYFQPFVEQGILSQDEVEARINQVEGIRAHIGNNRLAEMIGYRIRLTDGTHYAEGSDIAGNRVTAEEATGQMHADAIRLAEGDSALKNRLLKDILTLRPQAGRTDQASGATDTVTMQTRLERSLAAQTLRSATSSNHDREVARRTLSGFIPNIDTLTDAQLAVELDARQEYLDFSATDMGREMQQSAQRGQHAGNLLGARVQAAVATSQAAAEDLGQVVARTGTIDPADAGTLQEAEDAVLVQLATLYGMQQVVNSAPKQNKEAFGRHALDANIEIGALSDNLRQQLGIARGETHMRAVELMRRAQGVSRFNELYAHVWGADGGRLQEEAARAQATAQAQAGTAVPTTPTFGGPTFTPPS